MYLIYLLFDRIKFYLFHIFAFINEEQSRQIPMNLLFLREKLFGIVPDFYEDYMKSIRRGLIAEEFFPVVNIGSFFLFACACFVVGFA